MAKLNFDKIIPLFEADQEFSLTESQYKQSVGKPLPKNFYYLKMSQHLQKKQENMDIKLKLKKKQYV